MLQEKYLPRRVLMHGCLFQIQKATYQEIKFSLLRTSHAVSRLNPKIKELHKSYVFVSWDKEANNIEIVSRKYIEVLCKEIHFQTHSKL